MRRLFIQKTFLLVIVFSVPFIASASVRINEIAWMGTVKNSRAEWIELKNVGSKTVNLSGWSLVAKDGAPNIIFTKGLSIKPNGYFLLERTHKNLIHGVVADFVYKKSLSNSGEDLVLRNSESKVVDSVVSGKNWCLLGGSNSTKQTAQLTSIGWVTATSTPRKKNVINGLLSSCNKKTKNKLKTVVSNSTNSVNSFSSTTQKQVHHTYGPASYIPIPKIFLNIGKDMSVTAGTEIKFSAFVYNSKGFVYKELPVHFAFGDGSESDSSSVFKSYKIPGKYLVTATAVYGLGSGESSVVVSVHRALVKIHSVNSNGININNSSKYKLNLSLWELRSGSDTFIFPNGTIMLPNTNVLFAYQITKLKESNNVELLYPNNKIAALYSSKNKETFLKPSNVIVGCNNRQSKCSEKVVKVSDNKTKQYGATAILAPAKSVKAEFAGAHVGTSVAVANTISAKTNDKEDLFHILLISILSVSIVAFAVL